MSWREGPTPLRFGRDDEGDAKNSFAGVTTPPPASTVLRTVRASSIEPGVSLCTRMERARTFTRLPSAGQSEAKSALPPPELRLTLGYEEYDARAKPFVL